LVAGQKEAGRGGRRGGVHELERPRQKLQWGGRSCVVRRAAHGGDLNCRMICRLKTDALYPGESAP
jgi:hypothetical protein